MTMPDERTRAVSQAREFLQELATGEWPTALPTGVRREALRLLRHFPRDNDMELAHLALPAWFGPTPASGGAEEL
jgi:hypothetical protein